MEKNSKSSEIWKFIKFSIAGVLSTIVELGVFYALSLWIFKGLEGTPVDIWVLHYDSIGLMWSFIISTTIGYAIAFVMNRKITFAANANPVFSVVAYILMVIFTIFATTWIGMEISAFAVARESAVLEMLAKPIVTLLATVWTYPLNRFVIHRKKA